MTLDALSASDKDEICSAQSDTNSEQNKSAPTHNARALNDIRACAPKATAKPYFYLSNHSDGCLEINPNPELLTAAPYLNKAIRLPNAGNEFGIFSPTLTRRFVCLMLAMSLEFSRCLG